MHGVLISYKFKNAKPIKEATNRKAEVIICLVKKSLKCWPHWGDSWPTLNKY